VAELEVLISLEVCYVFVRDISCRDHAGGNKEMVTKMPGLVVLGGDSR
jgi:hypothetical protein